MNEDSLRRQLIGRLTGPLPGEAAWRRMRPTVRREGYVPIPEEDARSGAVLILLVPGEELTVPLIQRSDDGGPHAGQIALPGGASEQFDQDIQATALREASEEIGLNPEFCTVTGTLTPLFIDVSGFLVTPVVALANAAIPPFTPNPLEVQRIIPTGLSTLARTRAERTVTVYNPGAHRQEHLVVPSYLAAGQVLWGATAMILSELLEVISP